VINGNTSHPVRPPLLPISRQPVPGFASREIAN
jgi:hypothetical protein